MTKLTKGGARSTAAPRGRRALEVRREVFPIRGTFRIARGDKQEAVVVVAQISDAEGRIGRGECVPYAHYGESVEGVMDAISGLAPHVAAGLDREALRRELPAGAARNAIDCALWDLESKERGKPVWELAGLAPPAPVVTAFTISIDTPGAMEATAHREAARCPILKVKLAGDADDLARLAAVRRGAPDAILLVDANESATPDRYLELNATLRALGVALLEQPFPRDADRALATVERSIPICADESMHDCASLAGLVGRYDAVNIKLDKTGGLTEALDVLREARAQNLRVMLGCMVCTSLSIAPALLLAPHAEWIDLDGPLLLGSDRVGGATFDCGKLIPPAPALWGG